jgi:hypothetical protein
MCKDDHIQLECHEAHDSRVAISRGRNKRGDDILRVICQSFWRVFPNTLLCKGYIPGNSQDHFLSNHSVMWQTTNFTSSAVGQRNDRFRSIPVISFPDPEFVEVHLSSDRVLRMYSLCSLPAWRKPNSRGEPYRSKVSFCMRMDFVHGCVIGQWHTAR